MAYRQILKGANFDYFEYTQLFVY